MQMNVVTITQPTTDAQKDPRAADAPRADHVDRPVRLAIGFAEGRLPHIVAVTRAGRGRGDAPGGAGAAANAPAASVLPPIDPQFPQTLDAGLSVGESPTLLPTQSEGWTGTPAIQVSRAGREVFPHPTVTSVTHDDDSLSFAATDDEAGITLDMTLAIGPEGLIRIDTSITNTARADAARPDTTLAVDRLAPVVPLPVQVGEIMTCTGHHLRERALQRQPLADGLFERNARMGRPDFDSATLLAAGTPGFGFEHGTVVAAHVAFSGNSTVFAERTPYTHGVIGGGELPYTGEITLDPGETYHAPRLLISLGDGLNETASRFHAYLRGFHPELAAKPRPVTLNTWEAMYFEQTESKVLALADTAATIGIERFVIDDGWFTGRRDDTKGLGDWQVDRDVWPNGLTAVADHVHKLGMEFGLWFEPEMISPDSDAARAHPDWVLAPTPARLPVEARSQQVIDLTNPEAARYVEDAIDRLVGEYRIDYIKWDHNRFLTEPVSRTSGLPAVHRQTEAFYAIVDRLRARHPGLEIESCSSGGGRIDAGVLTRCSRVWASDCTDPVERADIQRGTSLLVPPEMIGEHISESPNHATRRATTLATRAATAFFGHLGIEWNIMRLDDAGLARLKRWIDLYKERRAAIGQGDVVHVDSTDPAVRVDGLVAPDRSRAVFRFAAIATSREYPYGLVRFPGLDETAAYRVRPLGGAALYESELSPCCRTALDWWNDDGIVVDGATLAQWGIRLPQIAPEHCLLVELVHEEVR